MENGINATYDAISIETRKARKRRSDNNRLLLDAPQAVRIQNSHGREPILVNCIKTALQSLLSLATLVHCM